MPNDRTTRLLLSAAVLVAGLVGFARPALARLDQDCLVSILNRTVQVDRNGGWAMPNVPSNMGQVRARATCVRGGETVSGQSDYFNIATNAVNEVSDIQFGGGEAIPTALTISVPQPTLTSAGATAQLQVTAHYPDNSTQDVSAATSGINYSSSNLQIATVDRRRVGHNQNPPDFD
jgi:large repetitive protein